MNLDNDTDWSVTNEKKEKKIEYNRIVPQYWCFNWSKNKHDKNVSTIRV